MIEDYVGRVAVEGAGIGRLCRAGFTEQVRSCPAWTGGDLLAHVSGFARYLVDALTVRQLDPDAPPPRVAPADAADTWDADLARLVDVLGSADPAAPVPNWAASPDVAAFWIRRSAHEFAIHRWDAATTAPGEPEPVPSAMAQDGIAEYLDEFVATALAFDLVPPADATLALELTDRDVVLTRDLPRPGPVTTLRGTAPELFLAVWRRRDLLEHVVSGDRARIESWPTF